MAEETEDSKALTAHKVSSGFWLPIDGYLEYCGYFYVAQGVLSLLFALFYSINNSSELFGILLMPISMFIVVPCALLFNLTFSFVEIFYTYSSYDSYLVPLGIAAIVLGGLGVIAAKAMKRNAIEGYLIWGGLTLISIWTAIWNIVWLFVADGDSAHNTLWVGTSLFWAIISVIAYIHALSRLPKKIRTLIISGMIAIAVVVGGGCAAYFWYNNIYTPAKITATEMATTNILDHYENQTVGIAFDYPQNWKLVTPLRQFIPEQVTGNSTTSILDIQILPLGYQYNPEENLSITVFRTNRFSWPIQSACNELGTSSTCSITTSEHGVEYALIKEGAVWPDEQDLDEAWIPDGSNTAIFYFDYVGSEYSAILEPQVLKMMNSIQLTNIK